MATQYVDLNKLKFVAGKINPTSYGELFVYSSAHSSERTRVYFNFRTCSGLGPLAAKLAAEFTIWTAPKEKGSALAALVPIRGWMRYLSDLARVDGSNTTDWTAQKWGLQTGEWLLSILSDPDLRDRTKNQYRSNVHAFVARMQTAGVLPAFRILNGIKKPEGGKKLSIALVKKALRDGEDIHIIDVATRDALSELDNLNDLTDSAQVLRRIDLLLGATRKAIENRIRHFWYDWQEARQIVSSGIFDPIGFLERHCVSREPLKLRRGWKYELTDDTDMIALLQHLYDGIIPIDEPGNPLVRWIYNQYSVRHIRNLLHSTPDNVIPFLVTMLIDRPIEVSYAAGFAVDAMRSTANPNNMKITYVKKRAGHRMITTIWASGDDRSLASSSRRSIDPATAFRCVQSMREPLIKFAEAQDADKLFLVLGNGGTRKTVKAVSPRAWLDAWDRFRAGDPILTRYRFTLDKIRPTLILRAYIVSGGDIFEAYRVAQHKLLGTTQRYLNEQVSEQLSAEDARNVQGAISLKILEKRPELRGDLRINEQSAKRVLRQAANLGFLEHNKEAENVREEVQSELVRFFLTGEIIVLEDPEVAAELIVFKEHLVTELPTLKGHPDYETSWLPLLVFLNAAIEAMLPHVRQRGRKVAAEMGIEYLEPPIV